MPAPKYAEPPGPEAVELDRHAQLGIPGRPFTGLLSNQGEKSINFYFIRVPLRKKVLKYGTPKPKAQFKGTYKGLG